MTEKTTITYTAGACNIGDEGVAYRRKAGYVMLAVTIALAVAGLVFGWSPWLRAIVVVFPAFLAANSFLQAKNCFCTTYGMKGQQNVEDKDAGTDVGDAEAKATDKKRAQTILLQAALLGIATAVLVAIVPVK